MKLENLFVKKINRDINGVIKADQISDDERFIELDEYIVTDEVKGLLKQFFKTYAENGKRDTIGVWIKGFFGSGKSHFLKILSYLLANKPVIKDGESKNPIDFFDGKLDDLDLGEIKKTISDNNTEVVLFNIDAKAKTNTKDSILSVFQRVFDEHCGYSGENPGVAKLERGLDEEHKLEQFKTELEKITGKKYKDVMDYAWLKAKEIKQAVENVGVDGSNVELYLKNYGFAAEDFVNLVKSYLNKGPKNRKIVFCVDEVGQFIGGDTSKMLSLQTITEKLGSECEGRAWIIVTSQADMTQIFDENGMKANDFSKILGRFQLKMALSSANVDEVIKKRLLAKTDEASTNLRNVYANQGQILQSQTTFEAGVANNCFPSAQTEEGFIDSYPFLPYQFNLLIQIYEGISKSGLGGMHISRGARSMLSTFQSAILNIKDKEIGALVPLHVFYDSIESFLDTSVITTIRQSVNMPSLNDFDSKLLKTLFLIRNSKNMPGTVENLAVLSMDKIDTDVKELKKQIQESLGRLEGLNIVDHIGEEYQFLLDDQRRIAQQIKNVLIQTSEINMAVGRDICDSLWHGNNSYRYAKNKKDFKFDIKNEDQLVKGQGTEDLHVIISSDATMTPGNCVMESNNCPCSLLIKIDDDKKFTDEVRKYLQIKSHLESNNTSPAPNIKQIYDDYGVQNQKRRQDLLKMLETKLLCGKYYVSGNEIAVKGANPQDMLQNALENVVEANYHKLQYIEVLSMNAKDELRGLLSEDRGLNVGLDDKNPRAAKTVLDCLMAKNQINQQIILKELVDHFAGCPFGWPDDETNLVLVRKYLSGDITFISSSKDMNKSEILSCVLAGPRAWNTVTIGMQQHATQNDLQSAKQLAKQLFNGTWSDVENTFADELRKVLQSRLTIIQGIENKISANSNYPGYSFLQSYRPLIAGLLNVNGANALIQEFLAKSNELTDASEEYENLENFFERNASTWDQCVEHLKVYNLNNGFLADAQNQIAKLSEIIRMEKPYSFIKTAKDLDAEISEIQNHILTEVRQKAAAEIDKVIEQIQKSDLASVTDKDVHNACLRPLQMLKQSLDSEVYINRLNDMDKQADKLRSDALDVIKEHQEKLGQQVLLSKSQAVSPKIYVSDVYLKDKKAVKQFVADLEKALNDIIDNGKYVKIV